MLFFDGVILQRSVHVFALVAATRLKAERCTAHGWTLQHALSILLNAPAPLYPGYRVILKLPLLFDSPLYIDFDAFCGSFLRSLDLRRTADAFGEIYLDGKWNNSVRISFVSDLIDRDPELLCLTSYWLARGKWRLSEELHARHCGIAYCIWGASVIVRTHETLRGQSVWTVERNYDVWNSSVLRVRWY